MYQSPADLMCSSRPELLKAVLCLSAAARQWKADIVVIQRNEKWWEAVIIQGVSWHPQYNILLPNSTAENIVFMALVPKAPNGL